MNRQFVNVVCTSENALKKFKAHLKTYDDCHDCPLYKTRTQIVFPKGTFFADFLFVGEAPGTVEDLTGEPFSGPSGKILNALISQVKEAIPFTYLIDNTISCIPKDKNSEAAFRTPNMDEIRGCKPKMMKLLNILRPKGVILLGKTARINFPRTSRATYKILELPHPSYLLRTGGVNSTHYMPTYKKLKTFIEVLSKTSKVTVSKGRTKNGR